MNKRCYDLKNLEKYENNPFIYERKTINNENIYSYKTIIQEASQCKKYLQKHQVKSNIGIAIDLKEHSLASCILLLGILNHECHFYCLNLEDTKDIVAYLQSSGAEYIISPQKLKLDNIKKHTENELKVLNEAFYLYYLVNSGNSNFENIEKCYTIATSGSTGQPKIVFVPYECIEPNIKSLSYLLNIQGNDIIFLGSPPTFDPFVVEFFLSLENGASVLITSNEIRLQPQLLLKVMFPDKATSKAGVTLYQTTPSLFRIFGKESIQKVILNKNSTLRYLILGGEDFPNSFELNSWLPADFYSTGKRIFNIYGITEISCWASICAFNGKTKSVFKGRVPLGNPLDNFTFFRLVDEHGNILHHNDCKGELEIGSCSRRCYIPQCDNNDEANLKINGITYRKTGDLVERDGTGNIYYIGRINNTIKRFGKRLCLDSLNTKVENILNTNNLYLKVISLWHKDCSKLIFYIVKSTKLLDSEKEYVINSLKGKLENHEQPDKIIYSQEQLPLNSHGKVDRHKILQKMPLISAKSPVQIFRDFLVNVMGLLRLDMERDELNVSATTNKRLKLSTNLSFIAAGGNSFQALSLATEIAEKMEENIEQRKVLEMLLDNNVTIDDILKFLLKCSKKSIFEETPIEYLEMCKKTNFNLKMLWRCDLKKCIDASPSIYKDKFVLVGSHSHFLKTVNALTGEEISCLELKDRIECPVVFANPQLALVGCYDGFLYGFDFNTGTILWHLNAKGMIKAKPLIVKNLIIIASYAEDYNIMAFDMQSLVLIWSLKLGSKGILSSPVKIKEESVLVCSLDGSYALIQAATGTIKWLRKLDTPIFATATKVQTSHEILLVLAEVKGLISICKEETGESITSYQADGNVFSGLTLHHSDHTNHSLIIFGCHDKNVYCLEMDHSSWQLSLFSKVCLNSAVFATPIVILKRYIVACSTKGLIVLLDLHNFSLSASTDLKAEIFSAPNCLSDKYISVGSRDNYLYCFQIENE